MEKTFLFYIDRLPGGVRQLGAINMALIERATLLETGGVQLQFSSGAGVHFHPPEASEVLKRLAENGMTIQGEDLATDAIDNIAVNLQAFESSEPESQPEASGRRSKG